MAVKLIKDDERLVLYSHGAKFFYRRIRPVERQNIIRKHTKRGDVDWGAASMEMLRLCVKGWEGVGNEDGEIPFSPELLNDLPEEILIEIMEATGAAEGESEGKA